MSKILNTLLCALISFLLSFLWIVYCLKETEIAALLAAVVALCCGYLVFRAEKTRNARRSIKRDKAKQIGKLKETLRYGVDNAALFAKMLAYYRFDVSKTDNDNIVAAKNGKTSYVALRFAEETVSQRDIVQAAVQAMRRNCDRLLLFGCKADQTQLTNASKHIEVRFVDVANTYELLEKAEKIPPLVQKSHPMSPILPTMLSRKRFGWYFASSIFMLAISVVSFFPWYTLAWATVSFALALYSLLNRRYNMPPTLLTLD